MYPNRGFSITPADFAAAAPRFAEAADALADAAAKALAAVEEHGRPGSGTGFEDDEAYADDVRRAESLAAECVRRLRELETCVSDVATSYRAAEDVVAGGFR